MKDFALSTPGSRLEEKHVSLVWHYRLCDPEFGEWKAQQLFSELHAMSANLPVKIQKGTQKIVEVSSHDINKGMALLDVISASKYDTILCVGDDVTDESMFNVGVDGLCSIKIGKSNTAARYRLDSPKQLRQLLSDWVNDVN